MTRRSTLVHVLTASFLLALAAVPLAAELPRYLPEAREQHGKNHLLVILAIDRNEPRVFDLNLEISVRWEAIEHRGIIPVDVLPTRHNVDAVARLLGVQGEPFAVVLLNRESEIVYRSTTTDVLDHVFRLVDLELNESETAR